MSLLRSTILSIVPESWAARMEAESRQWIMRCTTCDTEVSIWDAGGLRWKASGNPLRRSFCQSCGRKTWHTTSWRAAEDEECSH